MASSRSMLLLLLPGGNTISVELSPLLHTVLAGVLVLPFALGLGARHVVQAPGHLRALTASLHSAADRARQVAELEWPDRAQPARAPRPIDKRLGLLVVRGELAREHEGHDHHDHIDLPESQAEAAMAEGETEGLGLPTGVRLEPLASDDRAALISARIVKRAFAPRREALGIDPERALELARGELYLQAVHLGETLRVRPFDDAGRAQPEPLAELRHLMRCRVTGEEVAIDPRLIRILTQISAVYDRPVNLISGHRAPHANGTSPTSQHALGRAADIKIRGASLTELRELAVQLGARGVGLYPEKGFIHIDVRNKPKYFWIYSSEDGEERYIENKHLSAGLRKPSRNEG